MGRLFEKCETGGSKIFWTYGGDSGAKYLVKLETFLYYLSGRVITEVGWKVEW